MVAIEVLARQVGRSVCTIRRWESEGRIPPAHRIGLRDKRHWTEAEAAQIKARFGVVAPKPTAAYESLMRDVSALLGVELSPTLQEAMRHVIDGASLPDVLPSLLREIKRIAPDIAEQVEALQGGKTFEQMAEALLGEEAAHVLARS